MARVNIDDSRITGTEYRIRRTAIGLEFAVIQKALNMSKPAIDKWQRGDVPVPQHAREFLELVEGDVAGTIEIIVEANMQIIDADPPSNWPWGERCWFTVVSRAAFELRAKGIDAVIGQPARGRELRLADPETQAVNPRMFLGKNGALSSATPLDEASG